MSSPWHQGTRASSTNQAPRALLWRVWFGIIILSSIFIVAILTTIFVFLPSSISSISVSEISADLKGLAENRKVKRGRVKRAVAVSFHVYEVLKFCPSRRLSEVLEAPAAEPAPAD